MTLQINFLGSHLGLLAWKFWCCQWRARGTLSPWYFQHGKAEPGHVEPKYAQGPLLDPQQRCSTGKIQQKINQSQILDKNVDHFAWKCTFLLKYNCTSFENLTWRKKLQNTFELSVKILLYTNSNTWHRKQHSFCWPVLSAQDRDRDLWTR
jgi:hypothetical protein